MRGHSQSAAEYDPFGEPIVAPVGTAYGFTGELTDGNGLVYLRARYLAPSLGTFASRDPWRGSASAPRTWNGYAWVEGNVVNRVDPGGMQSITSTPTPTPTVSCPQTPQPTFMSIAPTATSTPDPTLFTAAVLQQTATPTAPNGLMSNQPEMVPTPAGDYLEEYWAREKLRGNPDVVGFLAALTGGLILTGAAIVAWPVVGPAVAAAARFAATNPFTRGFIAGGTAEMAKQVFLEETPLNEIDAWDVMVSGIATGAAVVLPSRAIANIEGPWWAIEVLRLNAIVATLGAGEILKGDVPLVAEGSEGQQSSIWISPYATHLQQFAPGGLLSDIAWELLTTISEHLLNEQR